MSQHNRAPLEEDPIVVTGMGCITPLGHDVESTWNALMEGRHAFINLREETALLKEYSTEAIQAEVAAPVMDFDLKNNAIFDNQALRSEFRSWHRSTQFAIWAAAQAAEQAQLLGSRDGVAELRLHEDIDPKRVSVFNGTGIGGAADLVDIHARIGKGRPVLPSTTLRTLPERVASVLSLQLGSRGPTAVLMGACATGNMNVINGAWALELGKTDIAIVGGTDAAILPEALAMFDGVGAMDRTTDPEHASRPFHQEERGFIMGEGAGIMTLERESHAKKRGATVLAILGGTGWTSDAYHDTFPDPDGTAQADAMDEAIEQAMPFIDPDSSGYLQTHGTGTAGDKEELKAAARSRIRQTGNRQVAVSSTKSEMGHLIGASGIVESIVAALAVRRRTVPQTLKYSYATAVHAARDWDIVHGAPRQAADLGWAVNNSFGFGGFNAVTVFARPR